MASGCEVSIDISNEIEDITAVIASTTKQIEIAVQRALVKTAKWLETHSIRELSKQMSIKRQALKKRFKIYPRRENGVVKIWVGLLPIGVHFLGSPKITVSGVRVGSREYPGAFIRNMGTGEPLVWRRKGRARLPIELVTQDISTEATEILARWERRVSMRFGEIFKQELNWVVYEKSI